MPELTALLSRALIRLRRRPAPETPVAETAPVVVPLRPAPYPVRGEDVALVRPYYVAYEWRRPRMVRRALWVTSSAPDLGPLAGHPAEQEDAA
jgi:hypothetical protein